MRKAGLRIWAASSAFAVVGVFGVFGLITDFVDIPGNDTSTGEKGAPPTIDIQLASAINESCTDPNLDWHDDSIPSVFNSSFNVASGFQEFPSAYFCVRAAPGSQSMNGYATVADFIEVDDACSAGEAEAGDTDCGSGTPGSGEISDFVDWSLLRGTENCTDFVGVPETGDASLSDGSPFPSFGVFSTPRCLYFGLFTEDNRSDSPVLDRVQTDSATWNWRIVGSE
jgi:hypothetical protein